MSYLILCAQGGKSKVIMLNGETARSLPLRGWRASLHPPGIPPGPATVPAVAPSHRSGALRAGWQG